MIKRIFILLGSILAILVYCYLHGLLWQVMAPHMFNENPSTMTFIWVGLIIAAIFTLFYVFVAALVWPLIGGTINYITGKEICSIPDENLEHWDED